MRYLAVTALWGRPTGEPAIESCTKTVHSSDGFSGWSSAATRRHVTVVPNPNVDADVSKSDTSETDLADSSRRVPRGIDSPGMYPPTLNRWPGSTPTARSISSVCSRPKSTRPRSQRETVVWGTPPRRRPSSSWLRSPRARLMASPIARSRGVVGVALPVVRLAATRSAPPFSTGAAGWRRGCLGSETDYTCNHRLSSATLPTIGWQR